MDWILFALAVYAVCVFVTLVLCYVFLDWLGGASIAAALIWPYVLISNLIKGARSVGKRRDKISQGFNDLFSGKVRQSDHYNY